MKPFVSFSLMLLCISPGILQSCGKKTNSTPTPVISSINPTHGAVGDTVTITGSGFQSSPSMDSVWFNGKPTAVISATSTQLEVTVPLQCGTGNVTVSVNGTDVPGPIFTYQISTKVTTFATGLSNPEYLTIDGTGNLYVTNFGDGSVSKISPAGVTATFASGLSQPTGITIDQYGDLYVASNSVTNTCTIEEIIPTGTVSSFATITGYVYGLKMDNSGNLYAANAGTASISKITFTGNTSTFATGISGISDIAIGSNGNLYATGITNGAVYKITQAGSVSSVSTGFSFGGPNGIAVDNNNNLYFTVFGNNTLSQYNTVSQINASGMLTTFAAGLDEPCGLIIDTNGNFYIANSLGGTVSKITFQ
jgi:sugar lactone lactonase YvrE